MNVLGLALLWVLLGAKNGVAFLSSSSFFYRVDLGIHIFYLSMRTNHEVLGGNYTLLW